MPLGDSTLGRPLSEVLSKVVRREPAKGYLQVDIGLVTPTKANPRTRFDPAALEELTASVRTHGILQPIVVVRKDEAGFEIVSGERRWRAAQAAGLLKVPVVILDEGDQRRLAELRLVENLQRSDLNPAELARGLARLVEDHGLTHEQLAERLGKERSTVTNALRLLALPEPVLALLEDGSLSAGHAKALLACSDAAWQRELAARAVREQLPVRQVERLAKQGPPVPAPSGPAPSGSAAREMEENLKLLFGAPVKIREKGGRGSITLQFHDKDSFNRVVAIMDRFVKQASLKQP